MRVLKASNVMNDREGQIQTRTPSLNTRSTPDLLMMPPLRESIKGQLQGVLVWGAGPPHRYLCTSAHMAMAHKIWLSHDLMLQRHAQT